MRTSTVLFLSYPFQDKVPVYGPEPGVVSTTQLKCQASGDSCNTFSYTLENHWGTHVDGPAHFFDSAKTVTDYAASDWVFDHPLVVSIEAIPNQLIGPEAVGDIPEHTDFLILKTGFYKRRGQPEYSCENPGILPELGLWLREKYPSVRAIGFDLVSLSPYQNRPVGRASHHAFLDPNAYGNPILIVEDMDLSASLEGLKKVVVAPLRIQGLDSGPCTILGWCS